MQKVLLLLISRSSRMEYLCTTTMQENYRCDIHGDVWFVVSPFVPAELLTVSRVTRCAAQQFLKRYLEENSVEKIVENFFTRKPLWLIEHEYAREKRHFAFQKLPTRICDVCQRVARTESEHRFFWVYPTTRHHPRRHPMSLALRVYRSRQPHSSRRPYYSWFFALWALDGCASVRQMCARCAQKTSFVQHERERTIFTTM